MAAPETNMIPPDRAARPPTTPSRNPTKDATAQMNMNPYTGIRPSHLRKLPQRTQPFVSHPQRRRQGTGPTLGDFDEGGEAVRAGHVRQLFDSSGFLPQPVAQSVTQRDAAMGHLGAGTTRQQHEFSM